MRVFDEVSSHGRLTAFTSESVPMQLTIHDTYESLRQLEPEWNPLLQRSYSNRIFSTFEWQSTWWETYQAGELWVVSVRDDAGQLVGIAPWFIEPRPDERVVRSIGCVDVTDYVDLIIDREHVEPVCNLLAAFLVEHRQRFTRINLCNIPEDSPTLAHLPPLLTARGLQPEPELQEVCPVIHLPDSFETYIESLDKKQRHELRRKLRRVEGDIDVIDWYMVGDQHPLTSEIDRFIALMAASAPAKAEFLADSKNDAFLRLMAERMYGLGWLQLAFLTINGEASATYMNFDYAGHIQVYNSGLLPDKSGHLSPGIVLLAYLIRHAIETRHDVFDFLRGNEVYKYRMGAVDTRLFMLKAQ